MVSRLWHRQRYRCELTASLACVFVYLVTWSSSGPHCRLSVWTICTGEYFGRARSDRMRSQSWTVRFVTILFAEFVFTLCFLTFFVDNYPLGPSPRFHHMPLGMGWNMSGGSSCITSRSIVESSNSAECPCRLFHVSYYFLQPVGVFWRWLTPRS